jgi:hypothetical protein
MVEEHVADPEAGLRRCAQGAGVVPPRKDGAATAERTIDGLRTPDGEPLQASDERFAIVSLDDEMDVVDLDRKMRRRWDICPIKLQRLPPDGLAGRDLIAE